MAADIHPHCAAHSMCGASLGLLGRKQNLLIIYVLGVLRLGLAERLNQKLVAQVPFRLFLGVESGLPLSNARCLLGVLLLMQKFAWTMNRRGSISAGGMQY